MSTRHVADEPLVPELETIAAAAAAELRALVEENPEGHAVRSGVPDAARAAIAAGMPLAAIADAERVGHIRARRELGGDVLRRVERAARRKREADGEYEHAIARGARLGLPHRDIAAAAQVAHGTVRAIVARGDRGSADNASPPVAPDAHGSESIET
jgi:SpoU rRNA methylase family enzyme